MIKQGCILPRLTVLSSSSGFSNYDYNYDNSNTNVSSLLCCFCSINPASRQKINSLKKSAGSLGESDLLKTKACKISNWSCVYHACMSDHCQKRFMMAGGGYGKGKCEKNETDQ